MAGQSSAQIEDRYAKALFSICKQEKSLLEITEQLNELDQVFLTFPDLSKISLKDQQKIINALTQKCTFNPVIVRFLNLLASQGRIKFFSSIVKKIQQINFADSKVLQVSVVSAFSLSSDYDSALRKIFETLFPHSSILFSYTINPELISGLVVSVGSIRIDASVNHKLQSLYSVMRKAHS